MKLALQPIKIVAKLSNLPAPLDPFASSLYHSTIADLPQEDITQESLLLSEPFTLAYISTL